MRKTFYVFISFLLSLLNISSFANFCTLQKAIQNKKYKELVSNQPVWNKLKNIQPKKEKEIVIISPSFNNKEYYKLHLDSVFMQNYKNYRLIYIDDNSADNTAQLVERYVQEKKQTHRVKIIKNSERQGQLANYYYAVQLCDDDAIVIQLDADDFLAHPNVLTLLNKVYGNKNVWMTYGQCFNLRNAKSVCKIVPKKVIESNSFRDYVTKEKTWIFSHLRTSYAWLFKKIRYLDFLDLNGNFFRSSCDQAIMYPMLEMAGYKALFIPDILLLYNSYNTLNTSIIQRSKQASNGAFIRSRAPYLRIFK
jgi:glycosyltransferase involved in cell wall biosynthesis